MDEEGEADKLLTSVSETINEEGFNKAEVVEEKNSITGSHFPQGGFMTTISTSKSRTFTNLVKFTATGFCLAILLVACQQPEKKVETAKEKVADAKQDLKEAKREVRAEWQENWLKFKRDNDKEIADAERRIIDLRKEVNGVDTRYRAKYNVRIDELEKRNNELRDRVNNYRDEGDVRWGEFKEGMKHDMDDLKSSLKNITIKNS